MLPGLAQQDRSSYSHEPSCRVPFSFNSWNLGRASRAILSACPNQAAGGGRQCLRHFRRLGSRRRKSRGSRRHAARAGGRRPVGRARPRAGAGAARNRYFLLVDQFIQKFSLRYDLRRPFTLHITPSGISLMPASALPRKSSASAGKGGLASSSVTWWVWTVLQQSAPSMDLPRAESSRPISTSSST